MTVRIHKFVAYLFALFQALAGLFHGTAYAASTSATPVAHAKPAHTAPSRKPAAAATQPDKKRDAYYRAEAHVLGDVARVVGAYKLTPPQRLAVLNYIGRSNRGLKIVSFGKSQGVDKFALKDAKTGTVLGVIGLRTAPHGAVIVDKATYAALDYKKYLPLPVKGRPDKKVAARTLQGSMELPLLQASLKRSKRVVALPGLRPLPGLDFSNARQCTARFNADGSGAEYCLVSKPPARLAGATKPATAATGKAAVAAAPVPAPTARVVAAPKPAPASPVAAPVPAKRSAAPASAPVAQAPVPVRGKTAPGARPSPAATAIEVATTAALVGAVTYFTRPTVDRGGRQIESGMTSRYGVEDSLPHYEYHYAKSAETPPAATAPHNTTVVNETRIYEEETDVLEENTSIDVQENEVVVELPPEPGAPAGTDFTPVEDQPVVQDDDGIPDTGGVLPPEESPQETETETPADAGQETTEEPQETETPEFNPILNLDYYEPGEGYGIPGLPGVYTGGPSDEEPDALKHDMEEHDYEQALDKGTPEAMDTFMKEHPDSEQADFERAAQSDDPAALQDYVDQHPDSPEAQDAANMIQLGDNDENPSQFDDQAAPENTQPEEDTPTY